MQLIKSANFKFANELNDLLPKELQNKKIKCEFKGNPTVKHLIETLGIPHTEVGEVIINYSTVDLSYKVEDNNEILVKPQKYCNIENHHDFHFIDENGNPRFVLDNHLGKLAVKLRILGLDTIYKNDYQDEQLAEIASRGDRILLTRDRGLLKRKVIVHGYLVRNIVPSSQVKEIINRFHLGQNLRPFRRCLICNYSLRSIEKKDVIDRLEPLTRKYYNEFYYCDGCDRIYWKGSHYLRMCEFLDNLLLEEII